MLNVFATLFFIIILNFCSSQNAPDHYVFIARMTCRIPEKHNFRYRIQYFDANRFTADTKATRLDNIGNGDKGESMDNNYGILFGNAFYDKTYELYALVLHDCTKSTTKMRTIRVELDDYSVPGREWIKRFHLDITERGEQVNAQEIPHPKFNF
ncbi:TransThyretin-Related family domain [Caenorhabditis elegans]|uniref:TransThyretin-Related family domain n=1 Tax=Caenorhabditis elegans TaxID=6239 RepID=E6N0U7_CAEEL|nr:TransThyretin-Related family domain [Caenorhabditis elegans]CCD61977.1 TransThyretin-Related family domain [Caenorhabditis elegans]|eukprot:NP_001254058.1 Uncharacterized protein CELE_B0454.26 [Caenorhabditis elegans]